MRGASGLQPGEVPARQRYVATPAGIAWITGLLAGLADAGRDVTGAGLVIGTSAGATVAAQLGGGLGLDELFARQSSRPGSRGN